MTGSAASERLRIQARRVPMPSKAVVVGGALVVACAIPFFVYIHHVVPDGSLGLQVDPLRLARSVRFAWDGSQELGKRTGWGVTNIPLALMFAALRSLGVSSTIVQQFWFSTLLGVSAVGASRLFRVAWRANEVSAASFAAGVIYAFNPYVLFNLKGGSVLLLPYALAPWLAVALIQLVRRPSATRAFTVVVVSLLAPGVNPVVNVVAWIGCAAVTGAEIARMPRPRRQAIRWAGAASVMCLIANLWWIGPFVASLRGGGTDATFLTDPITVGALGSSFREVFRLSSLWALFAGEHGAPFLPSQGYLLSHAGVALSLLLPIAAICGLARRWEEKLARWLTMMIVAVIPLAVSIYPPGLPSATGKLYQWLFDHAFVFRAFRSNYKWVSLLVLVYALTAPWLLAPSDRPASISRFGSWVKVTATTLVVLATIALAAPFFLGAMQPRGSQIGDIPVYWRHAAAWLDAQPLGGRTLFLPAQPFSAYTWGRPTGDIANYLMDRPAFTPSLVTSTTDDGRDLVALAGAAPLNPSIDFGKVLDLLQVSFVVQRNDIDVGYYGSATPLQMRGFLQAQPRLELARSFGLLDVYHVKDPPLSELGVADAAAQIYTDGDLRGAVDEYRLGTLAEFRRAVRTTPELVSATTSNVWHDDPAQFGPLAAVDGDQTTAWVSRDGRPVGEWMAFGFAHPAPIHVVEVQARVNGVDALPTQLLIEAGHRAQQVPVNSVGRAEADFEGIRTASLRITILAVSDTGKPNTGIAEVRAGGVERSSLRYPPAPPGEPPTYVMDFEETKLRNLDREFTLRQPTDAHVTGVVSVAPTLSESGVASLFDLRGASAITSSSRWYDLAAYGPWALFDGSLGSSWVGQTPGGRGEWVEVALDHLRSVSSIAVHARANGTDPEVTAVAVVADGIRLPPQNLLFDEQGWGSIQVGRPVKTLRIEILDSGPAHDSANVGFSEMHVPGVSVERRPQVLKQIQFFADAAPVTVPLSIPPDQANAVALGAERYRFDANLLLDSGAHRVRRDTTATLRLERLAIAPPGPDPRTVIRWASTKRLSPVDVRSQDGVPPGRLLYFAETADPFWRARAGGGPLPRQGVGNGYGAVWRAPSRPREVRLKFDDGGRAELWASLSLVMIVGLSVASLIAIRRRVVQK